MKKIEKKVHINAPVSRVWKVLTDPEYIEQWMMMPTTFTPEVGATFAFDGKHEGKPFPIECTLKEFVENKKLVYTWKMPPFEGDTEISIELEGNGETDLTLVHTGWENIGPAEEEFFKGHDLGWDMRIVEKFKEITEK